jgi:hypothetical protein
MPDGGQGANLHVPLISLVSTARAGCQNGPQAARHLHHPRLARHRTLVVSINVCFKPRARSRDVCLLFVAANP